MQRPKLDEMISPDIDDRLRQPLDDEERILMDPDTWDWDTVVEGTPNPDPHPIFEVRLSLDELAQVEPAAIAKGMTVTAFLKHAALRTARLSTAR
jgi:hypothetical protein